METITNKNRPFISIIIPVYNIGKYLDACICSILNSTYRDYEIILVDDGSTDSSPQICDKYKLLDHRIVVLHTANCGVSHARNEGLTTAKGEWVTFVDGDDIITDDMLDYLSKNAVNDIDLLQWGYKVLNGDTITKTIITESRIFSNHYEFIISENYQHSVWSYAFKREIIANNCIIFPPELRYAEDQVFILTYLFYTKKIKSLGISTHLYRKRVGSAFVLSPKSLLTTFPRKEYLLLSSLENISLILLAYGSFLKSASVAASVRKSLNVIIFLTP